MMSYPAWLKGVVILLGFVLSYEVILYGEFILMPLGVAALVAIILEPVSVQLERLRVGRAAAVVLSILLVAVVGAGVASLLSMELVSFAAELPSANERLQSLSHELILYFQQTFGISPQQQIDYLESGLESVIRKGDQYITAAISVTTDVLVTLGILPFFIFFMMYHREKYPRFLRQVISPRSGVDVGQIVKEIQTVAQNYVVGMLTVIVVVAVLNGIGFYAIGLHHFVFFATISSVLAVIPYVGLVLGGLPALLYALLFYKSLWMPVAVVLVFGGVQFLEGNLITPNIVGRRVSVSPFMALIALVFGGHMWGIAGMILFVPFLGILHTVFDEIEPLRPYGYLIGNEIDAPDNDRDRP